MCGEPHLGHTPFGDAALHGDDQLGCLGKERLHQLRDRRVVPEHRPELVEVDRVAAVARTDPAEGRRKRVEADGLADVVVHPGLQAPVALVAEHAGRHGDDPRPLRTPALVDPPRRLQPVHLGHLDVHQHHVVAPALERGERLEPVRRDVPAVPELLEQEQCKPLVQGVVLCDEDPQRRALCDDRLRLGGLLEPRRRALAAEHLEQGVVELRRPDRLCQVRREIGLGVLLPPAERRQQDQRQSLRVAVPPDLPRHCEPVELRHLHVENREVERIATPDPLERLRRRAGLAREHAPALYVRLQDPPVRRVVVEDQHAPAFQRGGRGLFVPSHRPGGGRRRDREVEDGPLAGTALRPDATPHRLGQPPADREPQAGPAEAARRRLVGLRERLEERLDPLLRHPDAGVPEREVQDVQLFLGRLDVHGQDDFAALRELHRIVEEVQEHLAQPRLVADHRLRHLLVEHVGQVESLLRREGGHEVEGGLDAGAQVERLPLEIEPPGLDLREVEDVVDHRQQRLAARADHLGKTALLGVEVGAEQELRHPDHRVHRRPDLVAHRGEERALRRRRGLRCPAGTLELADVVVERVATDVLAADDDGAPVQVDVDQRAVLARALRNGVDLVVQQRTPAELTGVGTKPLVVGDEIIELAPDRLRLGVSEELLGGRIPGRDAFVRVECDDGGRTELEQGRVVLLLPLELADVVVDDIGADLLPADDDRRRPDLDVDERAVLPQALPDEHPFFAEQPLLAELDRVRMEALVVGDQVVDVPSDRLLRRVPEQPLGGRVPRADVLVQVESHDRRGAELEERRVVLLLPL